MVFQAINDKVRIVKGLLFTDEFNIFSDSVLHSFNFLCLVVGKQLSLGFGPDA
jgi:hypothetical protein